MPLTPLVVSALLAAAPAPKPKPDVTSLDAWNAFVAEREGWCRQYRAAPNDKKKASIFGKYAKATQQRTFAMEGVVATVVRIEETHGGGALILDVKTPFGECSNGDVWTAGSPYRVEKGSRVFEVARELAEGAPVVVSLARVRPWHSELQPEASMCNGRWIVQYGRVETATR